VLSLKNTEIILPLHNINTKERFEYFIQTCYYLSNQQVRVIALCDHTIKEEWVMEVLNRFRFVIKENCNEGEWEKVKAYYDESKAEYIAICHADDYWIEGKLSEQLLWIENTAMVMSAYLIMEPHQYPGRFGRLGYQCPQYHPTMGLQYCMPSMWLLNKNIVKELPIPFKAITAVDLGIALTIASEYIVPVIDQPLMIWNKFPESNTSLFMKKKREWKEAINKQIKLASELKRPLLRVVHAMDPIVKPSLDRHRFIMEWDELRASEGL
jgi:hypothetical protein